MHKIHSLEIFRRLLGNWNSDLPVAIVARIAMYTRNRPTLVQRESSLRETYLIVCVEGSSSDLFTRGSFQSLISPVVFSTEDLKHLMEFTGRQRSTGKSPFGQES